LDILFASGDVTRVSRQRPKPPPSLLPPEQLLTAIVAGSDDAIISKDLNGTIMSWNQAAQRIFGYTPSEVLGRPITILIPHDRWQEEAAILARLRAGERIDHFQTVRVTKDGRLLNISLTISPIRDASGAIVGASKIARDITAEKAAAATLNKAHEQLKHYAERLEFEVAARTAELRESLDELETFSTSIPHDIRSPLRAICGLAQLLQQEHAHNLSPDASALLDRLSANCVRLHRFVDNVLSYARLRQGTVDVRPIDLSEIVSRVLDEYPNTRQANADVQVRHPLLSVVANEGLLIQSIDNLLSNAVKFVPPGTRPILKIWSERRGPDVRLWIEDNGIGIAKHDQAKIFELFTRLRPTSEFTGSGVGLAVARRSMLKLGGASGVESDLGKGSRFWIQLKAADA
jgi:PAS domain S-box-containing protein